MEKNEIKKELYENAGKLAIRLGWQLACVVRYTNLYYKINIIISNKMQEEIMIDFLIKEAIYTNKIYPEYNKEMVYFDKIYQANYQGDIEYNQ